MTNNQAVKEIIDPVSARSTRGPRARRWMAWVNKGLAAGIHRGVFDTLFDREELLDGASRATGFQDFGSLDFIEPLDLLLEGFDQTSALNPVGRLAARWYLMSLLCNRLRLEAMWQNDPCIVSETLRGPIFILGLPRTGSTMLHEALALHSAVRTPRFWESTFIPKRDPMDFGRVVASAGQITIVNRMAPNLKGIHRLGARLPHECVTIQAHAMRSIQFHTAHRVSAYNRWLQTCDWEPAYRWHARYLKVLQCGGDEARWLLKAPGHMLGLSALNRVYPDAKFIQLHRDPVEVIPSMASLSVALRSAFSEEVDEWEVGRDTADQWSRGLANTLQQRKQNAGLDARFIDVNYKDLLSQPVNVVQRILEFMGLPNTTSFEGMLERYLVRNAKGRHGSHTYSLERFGFEQSNLENRFSEYRAEYLRM